MFTIKRTPQFDAWLAGIKDGLTHKRLVLRLRKASLGNLGDVRSVGEGVMEMREAFGPGWRMYYVRHGAVIVVMLGGGDKTTQQRDIEAATTLAHELQGEPDE